MKLKPAKPKLANEHWFIVRVHEDTTLTQALLHLKRFKDQHNQPAVEAINFYIGDMLSEKKK